MTLAMHSRPDLGARLSAIAAQAFMGVGALYGGFSLINDAEGFGMESAWLEHSPFEDYLVPGLFLFVVVGLGNALGAVLALAGGRWWPVAAVANGATMFAWLAVETAIVRWQGGPQGALLIVCGLSGLIMLVAGWRAGGFATLRGLLPR